MFTKIPSYTVFEGKIQKMFIEVNISNKGFPGIEIIGLPTKEIIESKQRILAAFNHIGISLSSKKIIINLTPAGIPKHSTIYDMPICAAIIKCLYKIGENNTQLFFGELSLDGTFTLPPNVIDILSYIPRTHLYHVYIPIKHIKLTHSNNIHLFYLKDIHILINLLGKKMKLRTIKIAPVLNSSEKERKSIKYISNFNNVLGQEKEKRALLLSMIGKHSLLLAGSTGVGKSMILNSSKLFLDPSCNINQFVTTHPSVTRANMLGGHSLKKPGILKKAHNGILYLDELLDFKKDVLESLRIPLEEKRVHLFKKNIEYSYESNFLLLASTNLCFCGNYLNNSQECKCSVSSRKRYQSKLSGALIDRFNIVLIVSKNKNNSNIKTMQFEEANEIVKSSRNFEFKRNRKYNCMYNSELTTEQVLYSLNMTNSARAFVEGYLQAQNFSYRQIVNTVKLSRTIADTEKEDVIKEHHLAEAVQFKNDIFS